MCYSKEVSLAVGGTLFAASAYTWWRYGRADAASASEPAARSDADAGAPRDQAAATARRLAPFFRSVIAGHLCIGVHQLGEFLAITTGQQAIYKLGLIASISCMFFLMRSLQQLTGARYGAPAFAIIIAVIGAEMFTRSMPFSDERFFVRGEAHFLWGAAWLALFTYWNLCIEHARRRSRTLGNRRLLRRYAWLSLNASFVLAFLYSFAAAFSHDFLPEEPALACVGLGSAAVGHSLIRDTPSIWCVFSGAQALCLPALFASMIARWDLGDEPLAGTGAVRERLVLAAAALGLSAATSSRTR